MESHSGILTRNISESPIAIIDFETTGLTPGVDRVVEISVVRVDPGDEPRPLPSADSTKPARGVKKPIFPM